MENLDPSYSGDGMYREHIMDHYKNPHNKGTLDDADLTRTEKNPLCGDVITISLKLENKKVSEVKFEGRGCAISQAAASMITDEVKGKNVDEIENMTREDVVNMLGIEIGPVRTKCATLGLVAVKEAIKN
ncbi:SUF system NifU family Fe-S cluster assembly protein [Candidatus Woesearchaeota archaeon]|nr:SUF system NifU family Fe-S cluster assembly protein [Candidatus Woesearchaeota archaeon]